MTVLLLEARAAAAPVVRARVQWSGACEDRRALEHEMRKRGAELADPESGQAEAGGTEFVVVVEVRQADQTDGLVADVALADRGERRERREVAAQACTELHAAIAWVLVVLAKERRAAAGTPSYATPTKRRESAAVPSRRRPEGPPPDRPKRVVPARGRATDARSAKESDSRMGAALEMGVGFVPSLSVGPAWFVEHRPWGRRLPGIRLCAAAHSSTPFQGNGVELLVQRQAARLSATMAIPGIPVTLLGGVEAGTLRGSGPHLPTKGEDTVGWYAAVLGAEAELSLIGRVLALTVGGGLGFSPPKYEFLYRSGPNANTLAARSRRFEARWQVGLACWL